jgi:hypothetical protein
MMILFIASMIVSIFSFCKTGSVVLSTVIMFAPLAILSYSPVLILFFILSVVICVMIDKSVKDSLYKHKY